MGMGHVIDKSARLGQISAKFSIVPSGHNRHAIGGEGDCVAGDVGHFDAHEFLARFGLPDAHIALAAGGEQRGGLVWEGDVVDGAAVTRFK